MSHSKPFHRNYRCIVHSSNTGYRQWTYIIDRNYSESPEHYIRAFLLIQNDLKSWANNPLCSSIKSKHLRRSTAKTAISDKYVRDEKVNGWARVLIR